MRRPARASYRDPRGLSKRRRALPDAAPQASPAFSATLLNALRICEGQIAIALGDGRHCRTRLLDDVEYLIHELMVERGGATCSCAVLRSFRATDLVVARRRAVIARRRRGGWCSPLARLLSDLRLRSI